MSRRESETTSPMTVLENPQHEAFALAVATGIPPARAYVQAGFSNNWARQSAHRLLANLDVSA